jgi:hypothetical protein
LKKSGSIEAIEAIEAIKLKHRLNGILELFQPGTVIPVRAETLKARRQSRFGNPSARDTFRQGRLLPCSQRAKVADKLLPDAWALDAWGFRPARNRRKAGWWERESRILA